VASLHYRLPVSCALSARLSSCACLALIDLASVGKQTALWSSARESGQSHLGYYFLEVERMKDAEESEDKAAAVDWEKAVKIEMTLTRLAPDHSNS
jgi:hypothetical protein